MSGLFAEMESGRRGQILDAALEEFAERGYSGSSMRRIAKGVGVTEPALYRHFSGKRALFETLVTLAARRLLADARELMEASESGKSVLDDPRAALAVALADRSALLARYRRLLRAVLAEVARDEGLMEVWKRELLVPGGELVAAMVRAIDDRHGIERSAADLMAAVHVLMASLVGYIVSTLALDGDDGRTMADVVARGMGWVP